MNLVVVKNGRERPGLVMLQAGDVIASRWWDPARQVHVVEIATPGVPESSEVVAAGVWDCDERGHRFVAGNQCCMECGETWAP